MLTLGELNITGAWVDSATVEKALVYMPTNVVDGIEPSDEPMLASCAAAYAESYGRRQ